MTDEKDPKPVEQPKVKPKQAAAKTPVPVPNAAKEQADMRAEILKRAKTMTNAMRAVLAEFDLELERRMGELEQEKEEPAPEETPKPDAAEEEVPEDALESFAEAAVPSAAIIVETGSISTGGDEPLILEAVLIEPGFGNDRDRHYYPKEVLARDIHVFRGVQMHEVEHDSHNNRSWVSTVLEVPTRFTETGAPVARIGVHDPGFARRLINLNKLGQLGALNCSIMGSGRITRKEVSGKQEKVVESLVDGQYVDWVTRAGAGGRALQLVEKEAVVEKQEKETEPVVIQEGTVEDIPEPTYLTESEVGDVLRESYHAAIAPRLEGQQFETVEAVHEAAQRELNFVKEITGSGKPVNFGSQPPRTLTLDEIAERQQRVNIKFLGIRPVNKEKHD